MTNKTFFSIRLPPAVSRLNDLRGINRTLDNVYKVFGDNTVLLPVPLNMAGQTSVPSPDITFDQSQAVHHQARLTREAVAVACGHGDLFAIFFPQDEVQEKFLKANPSLQASLITHAPLGNVLWLRCPDTAPATTSVAGAPCWLGAGASVVVASRGAQEPDFTIVNLAQPVVIPFAKIVWPEPLRVEFIIREVAALHGGPVGQDPRNRTIPNLDFWTRCFAQINSLHYDDARESFFQFLPGQQVQLLRDERVLLLITEFLSSYGRQERFSILLKNRHPRFLKEFVNRLKIVAIDSNISQDELERFLVAVLEPCQGADVSSAELNAMHAIYFRANKLPPYPTPIFEKRVPAYVERLFRGGRSRKVQRLGKYCRGFTHVQFKEHDDG